MEKAEIVIVGGGVVGASVAYHLTERGCRNVLILEREKSLGLGSTGKATGGVRAQFETEINIRLSLYSLDFFRDWEHNCGYEPRGYLFLATDEKHLEFLRVSGERQRVLGYRAVEVVDTDTIAAMIPGLNCEDIVGGSFGPRDGFIDPLAEFMYVPAADVLDAAKSLSATPYDVPGVQFSHRGDACSFDAFIADFEIHDAALNDLAAIVRGADTGKPDLTPQSPGLLAISLGLSALYPNDPEMLDHGMLVYDALYAWLRRARAEVHNADLFAKS